MRSGPVATGTSVPGDQCSVAASSTLGRSGSAPGPGTIKVRSATPPSGSAGDVSGARACGACGSGGAVNGSCCPYPPGACPYGCRCSGWPYGFCCCSGWPYGCCGYGCCWGGCGGWL
ncbi:hypothetical protein GEV43_18890 [Actinomadura sp. J1-007]|uniref:hypothetical protein n=1 Tax=Actinomadura sp. J1-007 TaxID=2661913 RepID=UPI00132A5A2F|nr:hypothetical protein [Actinomadura sp. J1-007]MWK35905.1 hypothetical protein [Actinomadura sp. J1-007]